VTVASGGAVEVFNGGALAGSIVNNGTLAFDITSSMGFSGTVTGGGLLVVSGGGSLNVTLPYNGSVQVDDASTLEFDNTYVGVSTFSGAPTGSGGTLKFDANSIGPITVVNSNDTVIAQPGSNNWINAAVSYTLPANIDALFLFAGTHGTGNSDAAGDALYALDAGNAQTLNHASQVGANTVFTIDTNDTVTLDNVTKTSLTTGNFHFT